MSSVIITERLNDLPEWVERLMAEGRLIDTLITQHMNMLTALQAISSPHHRLSRQRMIEVASLCLDGLDLVMQERSNLNIEVAALRKQLRRLSTEGVEKDAAFEALRVLNHELSTENLRLRQATGAE